MKANVSAAVAVLILLVALGAAVYAVARQRGRRVPDDVALVGFDDSGLAATLDPPLTTMRQPFDRISAEMVGLLLDVVEGAPHKSVTMPATLVRRGSA